MTKLATHHDAPGLAMVSHPFAMFQTPPCDVAVSVGEAYAKACLAWQHEVLRFMSNRLQWDGRVGEALAGCKTFGDYAEVQKNWFMTTVQDYFEELNRLAQFGWKLLPSVLPPAAVAPEHAPKHYPAPHAAE